MMRHSALLLTTILCTLTLAACGGGGGTSGAALPIATPSSAPLSVSGDMLALAPSRGWNYQSTNAPGGSYTISLYADPNPVSGATPLVASAVKGLVATVNTSAANIDNNIIGVLGLTGGANGYNASWEVSFGSNATIPGTPPLVPGTLTMGQVTTPYTGVTMTVTNVGPQPGGSNCPAGVVNNGATVQYGFSANTYTVSYVPGCGITSYTSPGGTVYTLTSVASYASVGQASALRHIKTITLLDTARSLLGLERNNFPAAHLPLFR